MFSEFQKNLLSAISKMLGEFTRYRDPDAVRQAWEITEQAGLRIPLPAFQLSPSGHALLPPEALDEVVDGAGLPESLELMAWAFPLYRESVEPGTPQECAPDAAMAYVRAWVSAVAGNLETPLTPAEIDRVAGAFQLRVKPRLSVVQ
jgi:hypothetical protein